MGNDKWIMMGDFNQVELPDDSRGKSALISGREERFWRQFTSEAGLVDGFLCSASVEGWRFTRVAKRRGRRDAARLYRMYISGGASWMPEEENRKGDTYFKMNFHELSDPVVLEKIKTAWEHEPLPVRDDRRRWARGWARVKHALKEVRVQRDLEKRQEEGEVLGLISKKLSPEESRGISELPEKQEIEEVVFGMKRNKAPGGDGVTIEILRMCWPFVGDDCVKLIHAVWAKKRLLPVDLQSVIKLIPKGGDKKMLGNWRPISLLNLTYKIVTKLLARRVQKVLPKIIDVQQSGFVHGRRIADNLLSLKVGQDWVR
ncbi:hypothetical protein R1sor_022650 [Riccia sorocarpa]|uniref:Reverse transcriptase domain-containing protein n=1 Tax=Riccia sorocarpa TaxID=122646 RepID=A0ABD3GMM3_9MARC